MNGENNNNVNNVNQVPVNNQNNLNASQSSFPQDRFVFNQTGGMQAQQSQIPQVKPVQVQSVQTQPVQVQPNQVQPVQVQPQIPQSNTLGNSVQGNSSNEYKAPSKFKVFLMISFFVLLIVFVLFLPDIQMMVQKYMDSQNMTNNKITSGKLICVLNTSTSDLDKEYNNTFTFADNKLLKMSFEILTRGDSSEDEETLQGIYDVCKYLSNEISDVEGVSVNCTQSEGRVMERQFFDLSSLDYSLISSHFTEAGLNYPNYQYNQDMDKVESIMRRNGFDCRRQG